MSFKELHALHIVQMVLMEIGLLILCFFLWPSREVAPRMFGACAGFALSGLYFVIQSRCSYRKQFCKPKTPLVDLRGH